MEDNGSRPISKTTRHGEDWFVLADDVDSIELAPGLFSNGTAMLLKAVTDAVGKRRIAATRVSLIIMV